MYSRNQVILKMLYSCTIVKGVISVKGKGTWDGIKFFILDDRRKTTEKLS